MKAEQFFKHPLGIFSSAIAATILWGSAFPFIKLSYARLDIERTEIGEQLVFAGYRFLIAGAMIFLFFKIINKSMRFQRGTFRDVLKIGSFQTLIQYVLFYIGLSYSTGIQGSIIAGTTSFFQIIFAHFYYLDDKLSFRKSIGLLIGFAGVIIVNIPRGNLQFTFGIGEFLLLGAMAAGAFGNILAREGTKKMEVSYLTSYQMLLGSVGLIIIGVSLEGFVPFQFDLVSTLMLLYLSFLSSAGFILWNNVMKYNQVGKVSIYLFLVPVFGVFLSSILLSEPVGIFILFGLLFVASGIYIVNRKPIHTKSRAIK